MKLLTGLSVSYRTPIKDATYKTTSNDEIRVSVHVFSIVIALDLVLSTYYRSPVHPRLHQKQYRMMPHLYYLPPDAQAQYKRHQRPPPDVVHPTFAPVEQEAKSNRTCDYGNSCSAENVP